MTRSCGPCQPLAGSTGLLFRRRDSRLGSVHNRSEFIKNWYESVRPRFLLRSSLLGSYGDARRLDVTEVTSFRFGAHGRNFGALPSGSSAATSAPTFPQTPSAGGAQPREGRAHMARQFIYHMRGLTKVYPGNRKVLENVNLSFYPDAKIGVLGLNGSGKSTLLRIMAGLDTEFTGEAWAAEGARVGYLQQE